MSNRTQSVRLFAPHTNSVMQQRQSVGFVSGGGAALLLEVAASRHDDSMAHSPKVCSWHSYADAQATNISPRSTSLESFGRLSRLAGPQTILVGRLSKTTISLYISPTI